MELTPAERRALSQLRAWLDHRFEGRVREVILYGSRARGEGHEYSDVDVLAVVDELSHAEGREAAEFCGDLLTEHGVLVSALAVSTTYMQGLRARERLFAAEVARDGVPL